jgi:hypothetical protein
MRSLRFQDSEDLFRQNGPNRVDGLVAVEPFREQTRQGSRGVWVAFGKLRLDRRMDRRMNHLVARLQLCSLVMHPNRFHALSLARGQPFFWIWLDVGVIAHRISPSQPNAGLVAKRPAHAPASSAPAHGWAAYAA